MIEERTWVGGAEGQLLRARYLDQDFPRHSHGDYVIGVCTGGIGGTWYRGRECVASTGEIAVIAPGEVHTGYRVSEEPWTYRAIYVSPGVLERLAGELSPGGERSISFRSLSYEDRDLFHRFAKAHQRLEIGDQIRGDQEMTLVLFDLLVRHASLAATLRREVRMRDEVRLTCEYIEATLPGSPDLSELAGVAGLSKYHFLRVFSREMGLTPHAYLLQRRIARSRTVLASGGSLAAAARAGGFTDQSHFTKCFRRLVGVTPGEYSRGS